jgi:hypothetical protein
MRHLADGKVPSGIKLENSIGSLLRKDVHIFLPNDIINHPQMMQKCKTEVSAVLFK